MTVHPLVHLWAKKLITLKQSWHRIIMAVFGNLRPAQWGGTKCSKGQTVKKQRRKEQPPLSNLDFLFLFLCFWHLLLCNMSRSSAAVPAGRTAKISATHCRLWNILLLHMAAVFCRGALPHSGDLHADCHIVAPSITQSTRPAGLKCATLIHDVQQSTVAKPEMRFTVEELLHGGVRCTVWLIQICFLAHIPCSLPLLLLCVSRFLPCRLADATVMWSTLRCSSHYSLVALLTPSLRRKWERVGAWQGGGKMRNTGRKERGVE